MIKKLKHSAFALTLSLICFGSAEIFEGGINSPGNAGSSGYIQIPGVSSIRGKTIDNNYYRPWGATGTIKHNVNLLTGQPVYQVPLAEISAGGAATIPIALTYAGPVQNQLEADNEKGPTSWIGYGWDFTVPFVAVNHKGTLSYSDDVFYCNLGRYGVSQILQNNEGKLFVAANPAIKIIQPATLESDGQGIQRWTFQMPDGVRMIFGALSEEDELEGIRTLLRSGGLIIGSPYATTQLGSFVYRWDIVKMENFGNGSESGGNHLLFQYQRFFGAISSGTQYTRESYLKEIILKNKLGNKIESYRFVTDAKTPEEISTGSSASSLAQAIYETRYLTKIEHYLEDKAEPFREFTLTSAPVTEATLGSSYRKRRLNNVQISYKSSTGNLISDPRMRWRFQYASASIAGGALESIEKPFFGRDEYSYTKPPFFDDGPGSSDWSETKQESSVIPLQRISLGPVQLPESQTELNNWANQSWCSEKFCFVAAIDRNSNDHLYLNVWKNNGNYFTPAALGGPIVGHGGRFFIEILAGHQWTFKLIPWNDNLIVLDSKGRRFWLYEWDGETFQTHTSADMVRRKQASGGTAPVSFRGKLDIAVGSDFIVINDKVQRDGFDPPPRKAFVVRKIDGVWKELNEDEEVSGTCPIFQPATPRPEIGCLSFASNMEISASHQSFYLTNISDFPHLYTRSFGSAGFYKITVHGENVIPHNDYFISHSFAGGGSDVFSFEHFDGKDRRSLGSGFVNTGRSSSAGEFRVWPEKDYVVISAFANTQVSLQVWYKKLLVNQNGTPIGFNFVKQDLDPMTRGFGGRIFVRTHPYGFTVESNFSACRNYEEPELSIFTDPSSCITGIAHSTGTDYNSRLYEFDPHLAAAGQNPVRQINDFKDANGRNYFDITFSATDNIVVGKSCQTSTGGLCTFGGLDSRLGFGTAKFIPGANHLGKDFIKDIRPVFIPWDENIHGNYNQFQRKFSQAARIGVETILNRSTRRVEFSLLQFTGKGFTKYPFEQPFGPPIVGQVADFPLVREFASIGDVNHPQAGVAAVQRFNYLPSGFLVTDFPEFNVHLQTFHFPMTSVVTYRRSNADPTPKNEGAIAVTHRIDHEVSPLTEAEYVKNGLPVHTSQYAVTGVLGSENISREMSATEFSYSGLHRESTWPEKLFVAPLRSRSDKLISRLSTFQTRVTSLHNYHAESGTMLFSKTNLDGQWFLKQSLFKTTGLNGSLPYSDVMFRFSSEPPDATLAAWNNPDMAYSEDGAAEKAVSAREVEFDGNFPFHTKKEKVWRNSDPTLTDAELKSGVNPIFNLAEGWEDKTIVERRNSCGQPLEVRTILNAPVETRSLFFYEGRSSLLVGKVENAHYDEAAVLTAENGNVSGLTGHDWEGRWTRADAGYATAPVHTGRFSIKVVDNYGPTTNVRLNNFANEKYDYTVSAWIYSENNNRPVVAVQRFQGNGTLLNTFTMDIPHGESFVPRRWQRYELRLSAAQIRGQENLDFSGEEYLRIWVGTGHPTGPPGSNLDKVVYVDDIVCAPASSLMNLSAYNERGLPTSTVNNDHIPTYFEYNLFGNLSATRDDKYRIFSTVSNHFPGDND